MGKTETETNRDWIHRKLPTICKSILKKFGDIPTRINGGPSKHCVGNDHVSHRKDAIFEFWLALLSGMQRYWIDNFRKVAHNNPEYAQEVWEDSHKN